MEKIEYQKMYQLEASHWWFVAKREFIKTILKGKKFPKILDIGCGTGKNMEMLSAYGEVWGLDNSKIALSFCRQRGLTNLKLGLANKLPFKANSFDLVTIFDVLYHQGIKNDIKALKEIHRVLRSDGQLIIADCAYQWLYGPHDKVMQARQRYSRQELIQKVKKVGFSVQKASYIFMFTFPIFLINRLINKYLHFNNQSDVKPLYQPINNLLIKLTLAESKLLRYINLPFGSSIIISAIK